MTTVKNIEWSDPDFSMRTLEEIRSLDQLNKELNYYKEAGVMPENKLGTTAIEAVLDESFDILEGAYDAFKDGVQFKDVGFGVEAITSLYGIVTNVGEAVKEKNDLTEEELVYLVEKYTSRGLAYFMSQGGTKYGIDKTLEFVQGLSAIILVARKALQDGAQISDLQYLPEVSTKVVQLALALPGIALELKDLASIEVAKLVSLLIIEVYRQLGVKLVG